ncbi:DUF5676 family membrane protein [Pedobacter immunditicola]|uniref:DUF5676 family membrane protein n=1 Tax=Pedobacter immunditicola TaxID=3133440 RepID=UPI0030AB1F5F
MHTINVKRFGLATGLTATLLYAGCILVMATVGHSGTVTFFNSIFHGIDTTSLIRMNVPFWEVCMGIIQVFIIGWLVGACIAAIYNITSKTKL